MTVFELIEELKSCDPDAVAFIFLPDGTMVPVGWVDTEDDNKVLIGEE